MLLTGTTCTREDVVLTVDAEFTFTNPAINLLTLAMMKVFNHPGAPPIIWNTYQGYLKVSFSLVLCLDGAIEWDGTAVKVRLP